MSFHRSSETPSRNSNRAQSQEENYVENGEDRDTHMTDASTNDGLNNFQQNDTHNAGAAKQAEGESVSRVENGNERKNDKEVEIVLEKKADASTGKPKKQNMMTEMFLVNRKTKGKSGKGFKQKESQSEFPPLGYAKQKASAPLNSLQGEILKLEKQMSYENKETNSSPLTPRKDLIMFDIRILHDLGVVERLKVLRMLETVHAQKTDSKSIGPRQDTLITMTINISEVASLAKVVETINHQAGKPVATMKAAMKSFKGRGSSRLIFLNETPTYAEFHEVLTLTGFQVLPVLNSTEWKKFLTKDEAPIPPSINVEAGNYRWFQDLATFEGVLARRTQKDFTIQSSTGSYQRAYQRVVKSCNLLNNCFWKFQVCRKDGKAPEEEILQELSKKFASDERANQNFVGRTTPIFRVQSKHQFMFVHNSNTAFHCPESAAETVYGVLGDEHGLSCDYKGHRLIIVEAFDQPKVSFENAIKVIEEKHAVTPTWRHRSRMCQHCAQLHNSNLCPRLVCIIDNTPFTERVLAESAQDEERNLRKIKPTIDPFQDAFLDEESSHNQIMKNLVNPGTTDSQPQEIEEPCLLLELKPNVSEIRPKVAWQEPFPPEERAPRADEDDHQRKRTKRDARVDQVPDEEDL